MSRCRIWDQWDVQLLSCPNNSWFCNSGSIWKKNLDSGSRCRWMSKWPACQKLQASTKNKTKSSAWTFKHVGLVVYLPNSLSLWTGFLPWYINGQVLSFLRLINHQTSEFLHIDGNQLAESRGKRGLQSRGGSNSNKECAKSATSCHSMHIQR